MSIGRGATVGSCRLELNDVGFLDNVRSHFKNNDEEEFERAFRDPSWPVGVDDFEPMSNTGSFLPATYDVDPLADASLPGNALHATGAPTSAYIPNDTLADMQAVTESVVRMPATPTFAAPAGQPASLPATGAVGMSPLVSQPTAAAPTAGVFQSAAPGGWGVPDPSEGTGVLPPQGYGHQAPASMPATRSVQETPSQEREPLVQDNQPSGYSADTPRYDMGGDEGVQVYARQGGERAARPNPTPQVAQKPFADRLRERVAAANVAGQTDEMLGRSRVITQEPPARSRRNENASSADIDAELEERRRMRRAQSHAREAEERPKTPQRAPEPASAQQAREGHETAAPVAVSCVVVRPRSYDAVSDVAKGLIGEHRPVVMVLRGCSAELTRRILDFSFGLCCASGATMKEFGNHVYGVLPRGTTFTDDDAMALRRQGIVLRG